MWRLVTLPKLSILLPACVSCKRLFAWNLDNLNRMHCSDRHGEFAPLMTRMNGAPGVWGTSTSFFIFLMSSPWRGCSQSVTASGQAPAIMDSVPGFTFCAGISPLKGRDWSVRCGTGKPASSFGDHLPWELLSCVLQPRLQSSNGWSCSLTALRGPPPARCPM